MTASVHPTLLDQLVRRKNWTIEETCEQFELVARAMGEDATLSKRQLLRWMSGEVGRPRAVSRRVAERFWGHDFLSLLSPPNVVPVSVEAAPPASSVDEVKRRTILALLALSALAALSEPWGRVSHALRHPSDFDDRVLEELEWRTTEFFRREEHVPSRELGPALADHVATLEQIVGQVPAPFSRRLLSTTGEALALAAWLAWDSKQLTRAERLYGRAAEAASMAGDGPLLACVLAYRSYAAEADGDLATANEMLTEAQRHVRAEGSAATRAWVAARQAEVVSGLIASDMPALRALDRAMTAYDYAHPHRERSWTAFFTPSRLGSMVVSTYARLNHPALDETAEGVVASLPATDAKIKAVMLADVATATLQTGRYDRGAELANQALDHTLAHEASLGRQRLRTVHQLIRGRRDVTVLAALDDRLVAHIAA